MQRIYSSIGDGSERVTWYVIGSEGFFPGYKNVDAVLHRISETLSDEERILHLSFKFPDGNVPQFVGEKDPDWKILSVMPGSVVVFSRRKMSPKRDWKKIRNLIEAANDQFTELSIG